MNKKFYKCKKLYEEIIYQSKTMYNNYIKEYNWRFTSADSDFRFVKFECTSTYPRLLFIIRFVPVLKGLAIIHVYSQKKLSRNNDTNIQMEQGINCKEVDFIFGSFMKGNKNFEFKYGAPKKLEYVEIIVSQTILKSIEQNEYFRENLIESKKVNMICTEKNLRIFLTYSKEFMALTLFFEDGHYDDSQMLIGKDKNALKWAQIIYSKYI